MYVLLGKHILHTLKTFRTVDKLYVTIIFPISLATFIMYKNDPRSTNFMHNSGDSISPTSQKRNAHVSYELVRVNSCIKEEILEPQEVVQEEKQVIRR